MDIFHAPSASVELTGWITDNLDAVQQSLAKTGLVLFRGYDTEDAATLKKTLALFGAEPMTDARWSTPRSSVGEGAFTSTEFPAEQWIVLHSEMSYARTWPRLLMFQCKDAADTGGATTIADVKAVTDALGEDLVAEFHEREVIYRRNFRKGVDIPWQNAFGTEDWLGMVIIRIQRPSTRNWLMTLKDCEPPLTCITARVLPWVGRTAPSDRGIQSIWDVKMPVMAPWRAGETQTIPSDQRARERSSWTSGWETSTESGSGRSRGSKVRVSAPRYCSSKCN